jgi:hypothetical protein
LLVAWRRGRHDTAVRSATPEPPLRAQLLNAAQMEQLGRRLAQQHTLQAGQGPERMLTRLAENGAVLEGAVQALDAFARDKLPMVPAGEWLLDNYYLIDEQVRLARRHLPSGYSRALPALASGRSAGLPRVYDLAMQAVSHGDGQVDAHTLERLVGGYQQEQALSIGELWAVPIMLRLAVIENLRRIAARITRDVGDHRLAQAWARRMAEAAQRAPKDVVLVLADMLRSQPPVRGAFVSELLRHLRGGNFATHMPIDWLEQWVAESGRSLDAVVQRESIRQAAAQASIRNSIVSLRFITSLDWRGFVERCSVIEHLLRQDPDGTYPAMDFASRDQYRLVAAGRWRARDRPRPGRARLAPAAARRAAGAVDRLCRAHRGVRRAVRRRPAGQHAGPAAAGVGLGGRRGGAGAAGLQRTGRGPGQLDREQPGDAASAAQPGLPVRHPGAGAHAGGGALDDPRHRGGR